MLDVSKGSSLLQKFQILTGISGMVQSKLILEKSIILSLVISQCHILVGRIDFDGQIFCRDKLHKPLHSKDMRLSQFW